MKPAEILSYLTTDAVDYFVKYLKAIPSDKITLKPAPTCKSPLEIAQECLALCNFLILAFRHNFKNFNPQTWESCLKEACKFSDIGKLSVALKRKTKELVTLLSSVKTSNYKNEIKSPWDAKKIKLVDLVFDHYWHLSYHVGQLAYIQTLYGDTKFY